VRAVHLSPFRGGLTRRHRRLEAVAGTPYGFQTISTTMSTSSRAETPEPAEMRE
jgi:hypothetical protein